MWCLDPAWSELPWNSHWMCIVLHHGFFSPSNRTPFEVLNLFHRLACIVGGVPRWRTLMHCASWTCWIMNGHLHLWCQKIGTRCGWPRELEKANCGHGSKHQGSRDTTEDPVGLLHHRHLYLCLLIHARARQSTIGCNFRLSKHRSAGTTPGQTRHTKMIWRSNGWYGIHVINPQVVSATPHQTSSNSTFPTLQHYFSDKKTWTRFVPQNPDSNNPQQKPPIIQEFSPQRNAHLCAVKALSQFR